MLLEGVGVLETLGLLEVLGVLEVLGLLEVLGVPEELNLQEYLFPEKSKETITLREPFLQRAAAMSAVGQEDDFSTAVCVGQEDVFAAAVTGQEDVLDLIAAFGQEDAFCAVTVFTSALVPVVWNLAALQFDGATEATAPKTPLLLALDAEILEAVKFEAAAAPAVESGRACETPEQAARLDASTKLRSIEIAFFLLILFISYSPFLKKIV